MSLNTTFQLSSIVHSPALSIFNGGFSIKSISTSLLRFVCLHHESFIAGRTRGTETKFITLFKTLSSEKFAWTLWIANYAQPLNVIIEACNKLIKCYDQNFDGSNLIEQRMCGDWKGGGCEELECDKTEKIVINFACSTCPVSQQTNYYTATEALHHELP